MNNSIQIDVREIDRKKNLCTCYLYTERNTRATKMFISADSYDSLKRAGFFIRSTEQPDSADVLNTTNMYYGGEVQNAE